MDQELEELVARASDPRWIPAIYEYCDRRCGRCRFNDRCFTFSEGRRNDQPHERDGGASDSAEAVVASLERALGMLRALAEREGIDSGTSTAETEKGTCRAEAPDERSQMDARMALVNEPVVVWAREYAVAATRLLQPFASASPGAVPAEVHDAVESIQSLALIIASKVYRAVSTLEHPFDADEHPTQNDAYGSAKVAR